ncbi:hypothetical protein [Streptomyces sp. NPDC001876]|uniref:hypothetical protein n=1 Tax=Streptomyces sp. NPDC001876 TaxID=3154402 RepID=UPI003324111B
MTSKIHLGVEQGQKPLSVVITAGQRGDSPQFEPVLEAIRVPRLGLGRLRKRPDRVRADKADDSAVTVPTCVDAGLGPPSRSREIEAAFRPVDAEGAIELMTNLSAFDLVYSQSLLRDRNHAERAATRVAKLLVGARAGSRTRRAWATAARGRPSPGTASMSSFA